MAPANRLAKPNAPIWIGEPRALSDPTQVCIGVTNLEVQKEPIWMQCHRDGRVNVLFRKLKGTMPIDDKELRYGEVAVNRLSSMTFRELVQDVEQQAELYAVLKEEDSPFVVKIEKEDEKGPGGSRSKNSYVSARKRAAETLAFALQKQVIGKPRDILEAVIDKGLEQLGMLEKILEDFSESERTQEWLADIERIKRQAITPPTVIGVVGNTGSGKSSMLNAILDQERLMPTSGLRACTATVTEISYKKDEGFRAIVEFIDAKTWRNELECLEADRAVAADSTRDDMTDQVAASALAKLRAVYPYVNKSNLSSYKIAQLMADKEVSALLGAQCVIEESDARIFQDKLKYYVDSGEKAEKGEKTCQMKCWPLVKLVRVFINHSVLADGVTLVDLPGSHDANAARSQVAEQYALNCSGYLLVSLIHRAADDQFSKEITESTFRRQLNLDSGYFKNLVTFVCTKSDDINFREFQDSMAHEEEEVANSLQLIESLELKVNTEAQRVKQVQLSIKEKLEQNRLDDEPLNKKKEKLEGWSKILRTSLETAAVDGKGEQIPLTCPQIYEELDTISIKMKVNQRMRVTLTKELDELDEVDSKLKQDLAQAKVDLQVLCITRRDDYVQGAVRIAFVQGIVDIDQQLAQETDPENYNPQEDLRDYEVLRQQVPVFCISAKAYQALKRPLNAENYPGFPSIEQTKLPQLQQHCRNLADKSRATSCDQFLTSLSELLNSLILWSGNGGSGVNLSTEAVEELHEACKTELRDLESSLSGELEEFTQAFKNRLEGVFKKRLEDEKRTARPDAIEIVTKWNNDTKTFPAGTYKAICRRNGSYKAPEHAWNNILTQPLLKRVTAPWAKFFTHDVEEMVQEFIDACTEALEDCISRLLDNAERLGLQPATIDVLKEQLKIHTKRLQTIKDTTLKSISLRQREYSRMFVPSIEKSMLKIYETIVKMKGKKVLEKMHGKMIWHVEKTNRNMYYDAVNEVNKTLKRLAPEVTERIDKAMIEVKERIIRDCSSLTTPPTTAQLKGRKQISDYIDHSKAKLQRIIDGDLTAIAEDGISENDGPGSSTVKCEPAT